MKTELKLNLRQKTLLVFLSRGELQELDPIRIMKGLFLFTMEAPDKWLSSDDRYKFVPFDYGPCSFQIYSDLDQLKEYGYIRSREMPGRSWNYYSLTSEGAKLAKDLASDMHPGIIGYLQALRDFVSSLPFRQLLAVIYRRYPKYAVNSVFKF